MYRFIDNIRKTLFVFAAFICVSITLYNFLNIKINISGKSNIIDTYVEPYYEVLSDNVGLTNINGISNVYVNMRENGYTIFNEDKTDKYIDVSFVKDNNPSYRYYYDISSGRITFFCSDYESSYTGVSYIIRERK